MPQLVIIIIILSLVTVGLIHAVRYIGKTVLALTQPGNLSLTPRWLRINSSLRVVAVSVTVIIPIMLVLALAFGLYRLHLARAAAGDLTVEILAGYNLVVDSNVTSPSTSGPSAATVAGKVCNTSSSPITDVVVYIGDQANNTPGIYPGRDSTQASFISQHPALDSPHIYSLTHVGGSLGLNDATRQIGVLPAGECAVQYWTLEYPRCENSENPPCSQDPVWGNSVKPEDDLWLEFDVWTTGYDGTGTIDATRTWTFTLRNEISAMANKIQPNGNPGGTWFNTDPTTIRPGGVITTNGILYRIGNVRFGFDNNNDYLPDYNFWVQPIGDPNGWDPGCFRLLRTSGIITVEGQSATSFTFTDQLYFTRPQIPEDNTNVIGEVFYTYVAMGSNCAVTPSPYQEAASGYDNEKFNADYGSGGSVPMTVPEAQITIDKSGNPNLISLGQIITYTIPFQNDSATESAGLTFYSGAYVNNPLVISDTIPAGAQYMTGSASYALNFIPNNGVKIFYSTNNGSSWTNTEPTPAVSVTNIQFWLQDPLPPSEDGSVSFAVRIPATYSGDPLIENCANAQFGSGDSIAEACDNTLITGTNKIGDFVWKDDNGNGVADSGEEGINGVTINLYYDKNGDGKLDSDDVLVMTTTTALSGSVNGSYLFEDLPNGNFLVQVDKNDSDIPFGYSLTTDEVYAVTLSNNDYLEADFGFGPALSVTKSLLSTEALEGKEIQYKITVSNLRPGDGGSSAGFCTYDFWTEGSSTETNTDWSAVANAVGEPNGTYGIGNAANNPSALRATLFNTSGLGDITKVEMIISTYLDPNLNPPTDNDVIEARVFTGTDTTPFASTVLADSTVNLLSAYTGIANQGIYAWDITGHTANWTFAQINSLQSSIYTQKTGGDDDAIIYVDSIGFRVTTDGTCNNPNDTLNPVPLSDTFNADLLQFVSTDPSPPQATVSTGGTSPYANTGQIDWTNIGPIAAGETKEIIVTFTGKESSLTAPTTLTNTATVTNAYFVSGEPANNGEDDAATILTPTGTITGVVWSDSGTTDGWQGAVGYQGDDTFIPYVTVYLYQCAGISDPSIDETRSCTAAANGGTWTQVATTTTDINGAYSFDGLLDGFYYVQVDSSTILGGGATATADGEDNPTFGTCVDSDCVTPDDQWNDEGNVDLSEFAEIGFEAGEYELISNINFGYNTNAAIFGTVWEDVDGDGTQDDGEGALVGSIVSLYNGVTTSTVTIGASGAYSFTGLTAGAYTITVTTPGGATWVQTVDPDDLDSNYSLSLAAGQISGSHDFAYTATGPYTLGDTVYIDWDGDGTQDTAEPGISNVTVYLYEDENGDGVIDSGVDALITSTVTSGTGFYQFTNLPGDNYLVVVDIDDPDFPLPAGQYQQTQDYDGALDSRAVVSLTTSINTADFGYQPTGTASIGDYVWHDSNNNGLQGSNESGLPNILVTLYVDNGDGVFSTTTDAVITTTTTNAGGNYTFTNLISATYWVDVDNTDSDLPKDGYGNPYILTTGNDPLQVVLNTGDNYRNADFGFNGPAAVGNLIWQDNDGDGEQDPGEPGIANVTVALYYDSNNDGTPDALYGTTTTDAGGVYSFTGLFSNTYQVVVVTSTLPSGYGQQTGDPDVTSVSGTTFYCDDTNADTFDDCDSASTFNLTTGQIDFTRDFGYLPPRFIGNYVWLDSDADGVQDPLEAGLGGITVTVTLPGGAVFTTTTDIEGYYSFGSDVLGTANGDFTVTIYPGSAYTHTYDYDGGVAGPNGATTLTINTTGFYTDVIDFGLRPNGPYSITGTVFYDAGNTTDGLTDTYTITDTPTYSGVLVYLYQEGSGYPIASTTTDAGGAYTFTNLFGGGVTYTVSVDRNNSQLANQIITANPGGVLNQHYYSLVLTTANVGNIDFGFYTPAPVLTLLKMVSPTGTVNAGDTLTYTLTVSNTGSLTATGVTITDTLPVSTTFITATLPHTGPANSVITWSLGAVATQTNQVVTMTVRITDSVPAGAILTNTAWVTSNEGITATDTVTNDVSSTATIQGQVRDDVDGDGNLADAENGIPGVTIILYSDPNGDGNPSDGVPVLTTTTTITGSYIFTNVTPGNYVIVETDPSGYTSTNDVDGTANNSTNQIGVSVTGGDTITGRDFLDTQPAAIGNYVWLDENGDGVQDAGESGLPNVIVQLYNISGTLVATTTTDYNGGYLFPNLIPGVYTVTVNTTSLPASLAANPTFDEDNGTTNPNSSTVVTVSAGEEHLTADFGYNWVPPTDTNNPDPTDTGVIGDRIWVDDDGDGNQDPGEPGLGGITVTLYTDPDGDGIYSTPVATTTTDVSGSYIFTGLNSSSYVVQVTPPAGYTQTGDPDSTTDNKTTFPVVVGPGDVYLNADFGYQPPAAQDNTIGDQVWLDADGDGAIDAGEPGIPGVTIALISDTNGNGAWDAGEPIIATDITNANGFYFFNGVPDGNYLVKVTDTDNVLGGLSQSYDDEGALDNLSNVTASGGNAYLNEDFGYTPAGQSSGEGFIGDTIFLDVDGNGSQSTTEPGLEGVTVTLTTAGGLVYTTTTNENGTYWFGNLDPTATYTVTVITTTLPNGGLGLSNTADPDGGSNSQSVVDLSASGGINLNQDFGYQATTPNTISGTIWEDTNADGTLDGTETDRFSGVTVGLFDNNGNLIGITTTNSTGDFSFTGLPDGIYTVDVLDSGNVLNGYWHSDGPNDGNNNNSQTDPYTVTVSGGQTNQTADFGYYVESGGLGNFVWNDLNGNGIQDSGEPGISGITVTLTIGYPNGASVILNTTTDAGGIYTFTNLVLDENYLSSGGSGPVYTLTVAPPAGYTASPTGQGTVITDSNVYTGTSATVTQGTINTTYDFGFWQPATIGDYVWNDADNDGIQDAGESGMSGITVTLYLGSTPVQTTTTDATGLYTFTNVVSGSYSVQFDPLTYTVTSANQGSDDNVDSDPNSGGRTTTFAVNAGDVITNVDAGLWLPATIGDYVWNDADNDGIQDAGESGISGITVTLYLGSTPVQTTTTDAAGHYTFTNVVSGSYQVQFDPLTYTVTTQNAGSDDGLDSDANSSGRTDTFIVNAGQVITNVDAGLWEPYADLRIEKFDVPKVVGPGDALTYTIRFVNNGPGAVEAITITETLPGEVNSFNYNVADAALIISPTLTLTGADAISNAQTVGSTVTWTGNYPAGQIISGSVGYITFTVRVDQNYLPGDDRIIENRVNITGNLPDPTPTNNTFTETTPIADIEVEKATNGQDADTLTGPHIEFGETITWTYRVTNTGSITLTGVQVVDRDEGGNLVVITPSVGINLAPGNTVTFTYIATASATGQYTNTATVTGIAATSGVDAFGNPVNSTASVTDTDLSHYLPLIPAITLTKMPDSQTVEVGSTVTFTLRVTNTGQITLSTVNITDPQATCSPTTINNLSVNASAIATCTTTANNNFTNVATVTGTTPGGNVVTDTDSADVSVLTPNITLVKLPASQTVEAGSTVTFTIRVTNTGQITLSTVNISDPLAACSPTTINNLSVNASAIATCTTTANANFTNVATATGTTPGGNVVTDTDSADVSVLTPAITLTKTPDSQTVETGSTVTFTLRVTNTGQITLSTVNISDPQATCSPTSINNLSVNASAIATCTTTANAAFTNVATATGITPGGNVVTDTDSADVSVLTPNITLTKTPDTQTVETGSIVTFTLRVTNTGQITLSTVNITDPQATCSPTTINNLSVNASAIATCTTTANANFTNVATVTGTTPGGNVVTDTDSADVSVLTPAITLTKTPDSQTVEVGSTVTFTLRVTNTGQITLSTVNISDPQATCSPTSISNLSVNASAIATCTTTANAAFTNVATATGTTPGGNVVTDTDSADVSVLTPAITLSKTPNSQTVETGSTVTFTIRVTNTGQITLSTVNISDPLAACSPTTINNLSVNASAIATCTTTANNNFTNVATATGTTPGGNVVTDTDSADVSVLTPAITLTKTPDSQTVEVGSTVTFTLRVTNTGQITLSTVNITDPQATCSPTTINNLSVNASAIATCTTTANNDFTNVATATGTTPGGNVVTDTDSADVSVLTPAITLTKTPDNQTVEVGSTVTFTLRVTNTGQITLSTVNISDPLATCSPTIINNLSVNASAIATCTTTANANFTNVATATGTTPGGNVVTDTDSADVSVLTPAITLTKTPDTQTVETGSTVTFTLRVTNTGQITLSTVNITDPQATCSPTSINNLSVNASVIAICTTIANANFTNVATATGTTPGGNVVTDTDSADVSVLTPNITLVKLPASQTVETGSTVTFTLRVTNTGQITLSTVNISDPQATCSPTTINNLSVNASAIATCTTTANSNFTNVATATGTTPGGNVITDTDSADVSVLAPAITLTKTPDSQTVETGSTVTFTLRVTNTGQITLSTVNISDPQATCSPTTINNLSVNASAIATCTTTANNDFTNVATATGTTPGGNVVTDTDSADVSVLTPAITLTKTPDNQTVEVGSTVTFTLRVTNTGQITLSTVNITDPQATCSPTTINNLSVNASAIATCTTTANNNFTNVATVTGTTPGGNVVTDTDSADVSVLTPAITLSKTPNSQTVETGSTVTFTIRVTNTGQITLSTVNISDPLAACSPTTINNLSVNASAIATCTTTANANFTNVATATGTTPGGNVVTDTDSADVSVLTPAITLTKTPDSQTVETGSTVTFTLRVTNTGQITLSTVNISDPQATCSPTTINNLSVNASAIATCTTTANAAFTNVATATGTTPGGNVVTDTDSADVSVLTPAITLTKTPDTQTVETGSTVTFTLRVTNTGQITLSTVNISDPQATCSPTSISNLSVNASAIATCTTTANAAFTNVATATGTTPGGNVVTDTDSADVSVLTPAITLMKTPDSQTVETGSTVTFTLRVTNTGQITLSTVNISDPQATCSPTIINNLSVKVSAIATCTTTANANFTNVATATGTTPGGNVVTDTDSADVSVLTPAITLTKTPDSQTVETGSTVTFTLRVTNTGQITLSTVNISDPQATCSPTIINNLSVNASAIATCTTTTNAAFTNVATATGTTPSGNVVTDTDSADVSVLASAIALAKTPDSQSVGVGETVTFTIRVTNTGQITLNTVQISDPLVSTCSRSNVGPLAAGAFTTYTCSVANVSAGFTNVATATGTTPGGSVVTDTDTADVTVSFVSGLTISKTRTSNGLVAPGDPVIFEIVVVNTGTITLTTVPLTDTYNTTYLSYVGGNPTSDDNINDGQLNWTNIGPIAPSDRVTITVNFTASAVTNVTTNTATVSATDSNGGSVPEESDDDTVAITGQPILELVKSALPIISPGQPLKPSDLITYTLSYVNRGSVAATGVVITDAIPFNTTYITNSVTTNTGSVEFYSGSWGSADTGASTQALRWLVGTVPADGVTRSVTFTVRINTVVVNPLTGMAARYTPQGWVVLQGDVSGMTLVTPTVTATPTVAATPIVTATPEITVTATPVITTTPVPTPSVTATPVITQTPELTITVTSTPVPTPTATVLVTATPTTLPTPTREATSTITPTDTPQPTATATPIVTPETTPTQAGTLNTPTLTPIATDTMPPTATATVPAATESATPDQATNTPTVPPTATVIEVPTETPTVELAPTQEGSSDASAPEATATDDSSASLNLHPAFFSIGAIAAPVIEHIGLSQSLSWQAQVTATLTPTVEVNPTLTPTATLLPTATFTPTTAAIPAATFTPTVTATTPEIPTATVTADPTQAIPTVTVAPTVTPTVLVTEVTVESRNSAPIVALDQLLIQITNVATITSNEIVTPTKSNTVTTPVLRIVDPAISKSASPANALPGETVNYFIIAENLPTSNADATNVVVVDALPHQLDLVRYTVSSPPGTTPPLIVITPTVTTGFVNLVNHPAGITQTDVTTITLNIPVLPPGQQVRLDIETKVNNTALRPETINNVTVLSAVEACLSPSGFRSGAVIHGLNSHCTDDTAVNVPPPPPPSASDDDNDDNDDDDDGPSPTLTPTPIPAVPAVQPEPALPVKFLPETGFREDRPGVENGPVVVLFVIITGVVLALFGRKRYVKQRERR